MWFVSKYKKIRKTEKGRTPFLRKALPERCKHRTIEKDRSNCSIGGVLFLWVVFGGTLFYLFFFSSFVLVERPQITGTIELVSETLGDFVADEIAGKYFGIFPKRAYPVIPVSTIERRLHENFPLIAHSSLTRSFPNTLALSVTERKKILLWVTPDMTYMVDEKGVLEKNEVAETEAYMKYILTISDTSDTPVSQGTKVLNEGFEAFLISLNEVFPEQLPLGLEPHYKIVSQFSDELRARTTEGWEVYFSTSFPLEKSLRTLRLLLEKELPESARVNLEYIDLRVENRIYYTFRDGMTPEVVSSLAVPDVQEKNDAKKEVKKKK